jgi:CRISPR-associated exonuclease Cas4
LGDIVPPSLAAAITSEAAEASEERLRLLYVACTRAMDLLVLPELSWADDTTWARAIDFNLPNIPELDISRFTVKPAARSPEPPNGQSAAAFTAEQVEVNQAFHAIHWICPSDGDTDILLMDRETVAWEQTVAAAPQAAGSSVRGAILHKLMEELLTREVTPSVDALEQRCAVLIPQLLAIEEKAPRLDVKELVGTAWRTFSLPELAHDRDELVPEVPVYGSIGGNEYQLVSGRADAVRYRDGRARIVFDWKSDVSPDAAVRAAYTSQLAQYVHVLGAERGAVVYMTTGQIDWIYSGQQT